jgi:hypothetical protein
MHWMGHSDMESTTVSEAFKGQIVRDKVNGTFA